MKAVQFPPLTPKVILGVAAHPDDLEYWAGGSIARWVREGATAHLFILTKGSKGTADRSLHPTKLQQVRQAEQQSAAKILGVQEVLFGEHDDCGLAATPELKQEIVRVIRRLKPDTVLTMDPSFFYASRYGFINHPDHRAVGEATLDAVYPLARGHLNFPELLENEGLEPHTVQTLLLTNFEHHNFCVDVTGTVETKLKAWGAHVSQANIHNAKKLLEQMAADCGQANGVQYAEGFVRIDVMA